MPQRGGHTPHCRPLSSRFRRAALLPACVALSLAHAEDTRPFPNPGTKKGLQVRMVPDALALGIRHAALNVSLGELFSLREEAGSQRMEVAGKAVWIREAAFQKLDSSIMPLSDAGVVIYLILLAYPTQDAEKDKLLLHPQARADRKYTIAGFNTATEDGLSLYRALVSRLAERYAGRVWGYIVGNEVNSQFSWYNLGDMPLTEACGEYEIAVRTTHESVRKFSQHARVYLSFDHHWGVRVYGKQSTEAYPTREFLSTFADIARSRGDFEWHVAHHPYPDDLGNPRTWLDKAALPGEDSPHVTFKNLGVACRYMEKPELLWNGKPRRIILSEQGIHRLQGPEGETLQAAGFAYAWENVARQPLIDALIWHRHVDHAHEGGLRLGLWENKPGTIADPGRKLLIHDLFRQAGTPAWPDAALFALPLVGLERWDDLKP